MVLDVVVGANEDAVKATILVSEVEKDNVSIGAGEVVDDATGHENKDKAYEHNFHLRRILRGRVVDNAVGDVGGPAVHVVGVCCTLHHRRYCHHRHHHCHHRHRSCNGVYRDSPMNG